jgi:NADPH:quinone reductase-like Zn-dependent oxidoreductase
MRAMVIHGYGDPDVLVEEDVPEPIAAEHEVLIRVDSCAVEPGLDAMARRGTGTWPIRFPHVLGAATVGRMVGRVSAPQSAGQAGALSEGHRVAIIPSISCGGCTACRDGRQNSCAVRSVVGIHRWGGYADLVAVPASNVVPLPDTLDPVAAAALVVSGVTAWHLMVRRADVRPGETVVVTGAAGNVGLVAAQIAASRGARVVAIGRSGAALATLATLVPGAHLVPVAATATETKALVLEVTGPHGADVVVDTVGSALWDVTSGVIATDGRIATAGGASGRLLEIDLPSLYRRNVTIFTSSQGTYNDAHDLFAAASAGLLSLPVTQTYPLSEAAAAHRALEAGGTGKLALSHGRV